MSMLQDLRLKLQKRVNRLRVQDPHDFEQELKRFWLFFDSIPEFSSAASELQSMYPTIPADLDAAVGQERRAAHRLIGLSEGESAAIGLEVLRRVARDSESPRRMAFMGYTDYMGKLEEVLERFRELYLEPFYEWIDEALDDRNMVLAELVRFKHLAEWFRRDRLWARYTEQSRRGEHNLAYAVYEFLFEQGIDFHIEPASASGEADMVAAQHSAKPLVADIKVFDPPRRGGLYIKKGLEQVNRYLHDYNQPFGYLVVFLVCPQRLVIDGATTEGNTVPYVHIGEKTIFIVSIDIFPHEEPASRRGGTQEERVSVQDLLPAAFESSN